MYAPPSAAFIGTGIMGGPMAGHLLKAGVRLTVHNRTKAKSQALLEQGASWADSPAAAAENVQFVFINVTDTPDVERVVLGPAGVIEADVPGQIVVDHSTISPAATREMAGALAARGKRFLDAPVSGGDVGARNAALSIMVGGDRAAFEAAEPLLRHMGKTITHCGGPGTGQLTKLVNQVLVSVTNLAVCEALAFARSAGLDPEKTIAAVAGGAAGSWQLQNLGPRMLKGDFAPGFTIDLQLKDLRLVAEAAAAAKTPLPALSLVQQLFTSAVANGEGQNGTQGLFKVLERLAGR